MDLKEITNESGTFYVDSRGVLRRFACGLKNNLDITKETVLDSRRVFSLHIPEGVRVLPGNAFWGYRVNKEVTFPASLEVLGTGGLGAFRYCELSRVILPRSAAVDINTFSASVISEIAIPDGADPGMLRQISRCLCFALTSLGYTCSEAFEVENGEREALTELQNACGSFFVDSCGVLREVRLHESVRAGERELLKLEIPEGVAALPDGMFRNDSQSPFTIRELVLPQSLRIIGSGVFGGCTLSDVVLPGRLELIGNGAFGGSRIRSFTVPGSLKYTLQKRRLRQFGGSEISEIRAPLEYQDILEKICGGWAQYVSGEQPDPEFGRLCYVRGKHHALRGENVVPALFEEMECEVTAYDEIPPKAWNPYL